jgi:uncharacterized protein with PhoU and TrkA domain
LKKSSRQVAELRETLLELKNTAELMIDLAYSALIFNDRETAEEIRRLEDYVDKLHTKFELSVLSLKQVAKSEELLGLIRIGSATERIADAAFQIAEVVLRGVEPHPIMSMVMDEAEETITKVRVARGSVLAGRSLEELSLPDKIGQRIIAIRKKARWIYCPRRDTVIESGDVIIARGYASGREKLRGLALAELKGL